MDYGTTVTTGLSFDEAVNRTREVLQEQGFGVLTEIDVQATLKSKLDQDMEQYLILGACNPLLAHRALDVERGRAAAVAGAVPLTAGAADVWLLGPLAHGPLRGEAFRQERAQRRASGQL